ncbi:MAG: hypothetical protein IBX64_08710 [Actinobacteria bacterium]|nr:hypothetical protein [Actinomycetota bacterium]
MAARLSLIGKLVGGSPIHFLIVAPLSICFTILLMGVAWAATVSVSSEPVKRGSVTPGLENVVMQTLVLKTDAGSAQWRSVKINEYGTSDAVINISSVKIYKETNGIGGIQFGGFSGTPDTTVSTTPGTFIAEETVFTFSSAQNITTTPATYYIVYAVSPTAVANGSPTIGSRLNNETYITVSSPYTVEAFTNLQSREVTLVTTPHGRSTSYGPFSPATNLCQTCHGVHLAPDFGPDFNLTGNDRTRRILVQPYFESPSVVNNFPSDVFNALCLSCHDGTGASTNIKAKYNDPLAKHAGHETTRTGSNMGGYKPPSGQPYNAGVKMPCMICHDVHSSAKANYKMLADGLYDYAIGNGWIDPNANGRIDDTDDEPCIVCHKRSTETARESIIFGISLVLPTGHDDYINCLACHKDVHALDNGN